MKVRVTKEILSHKHEIDGLDARFTILFPGEYSAHLFNSGELGITDHKNELVYLPFIKLDKNLINGQIVVLEG